MDMSNAMATEPPFMATPLAKLGTGVDLSIRELAEKIRDLVHPAASLRFDVSKPDGTPRKVLDTTRLTATGWTPTITLDDGIATTYDWFLQHEAEVVTR